MRNTRPGRTAHPHGCGEDPSTTARVPAQSGSPPRAWRGPSHDTRRPAQSRLTPTGVGRTLTWTFRVTPPPAHPHGRGRTPRRTVRRPNCSAHPHGRGEDVEPQQLVAAGEGSPPRAWGGHRQSDRTGRQRRLTPTGVGRTATRTSLPRPCTAHPHGRGEDRWRASATIALAGSPPRAWGGRNDAAAAGRRDRLTPTGVGRTQSDPARGNSEAAHPHGAWGGRHRRQLAHRHQRLTPTGVGRTFRHPRSSLRRAAHPHGRGEDTPRFSAYQPTSGSPPRAWGGRPERRPQRAGHRLTPTGVGRT